jgi:hypothetical protein
MVSFKEALEVAKKFGEESMRKEKTCLNHVPISTGKKIARCRCGLMAKIDAPVWRSK